LKPFKPSKPLKLFKLFKLLKPSKPSKPKKLKFTLFLRMRIKDEIAELVDNNVISIEVAKELEIYYRNKKQNQPNRLFLIFAVLGAALIGMGLILIIAHNWDSLPRLAKIAIAFIPTFIGQGLCVYSFAKKEESRIWKESTATFLFFAVALGISLISQVYNIPGSFSGFVFLWMLLCLPLVYVLNSSMISLFYIIGITAYTLSINFGGSLNAKSFPNLNYLWLLALVLPHFIKLLKLKIKSNFLNFHHVLIPLSIGIAISTFIINDGPIIFLAYMAFFAVLYQLGKLKLFHHLKSSINTYSFLGAFGSICLLIFFSFDESWKELMRENLTVLNIYSKPEFFVSFFLFITAILLLAYNILKNKTYQFHLLDVAFIIFWICFFIGFNANFPMILINLLILLIGINYILTGIKLDHLSLLNFGLITIIALVFMRFFDTSLSFVFRGVIFVLLGIGFFAANYYLIQKKKKLNESI